MSVYYNEFDPFAAAWLRNLIAAGHLPAGDVDERSIVDVSGDDLSASNRVGLLRGSGNAIVPQAAAEFVRAFMECLP